MPLLCMYHSLSYDRDGIIVVDQREVRCRHQKQHAYVGQFACCCCELDEIESYHYRVDHAVECR
jgi:hypothetical protein